MDIQPHRINPDLLPQVLQDLVDVIGLSATLSLVKARPGVAVYIPAKPHPDHPLASIIGFDALVALSKVYAQEGLRLPKLDAAERQIKHQVVKEMTEQNCSIRSIALAVGYTTRRVEQLRSEQQQDSPQSDLFNSQEACR